ncbi:proline racemase family protein [Paramicrobacterium chengjingii]|uniref:Proline racemase family protein n=1 Tax=Paramicrobacterium chengjingii TaxID=2769067 RepID=A0ABX6YI36_9MICO|nr:proline racemase family protein [Microbacterium chengjingii]QPZ38071.1 proline racemase family protein [Microbacterium chengjingii]
MDAVSTVDFHTAGEPFRIVVDAGVPLAGDTVAERRMHAMAPESRLDVLRKILCFEPRGHADMYGGFITPPDDDGADFGVLFWHKDGFSTACGHGTIALGAWAVETALVAAPDTGARDVVIDVPSGRVTARVHTEAGLVTSVDFVNVPSYMLATAVPVATSRGDAEVDVSYGGAIYAQLDAASVGLRIEPRNIDALIAVGREIKWALNDAAVAQHPGDPRLSGVYGTILFEQLEPPDATPHTFTQRNVTVFADGQVDRSPCGSGTAARIATLAATRSMRDEDVLLHDSIVGSRFTGSIRSRTRVHNRDAVVPQVTGMAYRTGESTFTVDPRDPLIPGFVLR